MAEVILGGLLLYGLTRPRGTVSDAALATLGVVTDTEYLTLEPTVVAKAVEIISVEVIADPVPGTYAKVWVHLKANAPNPILGDFCRIIDDDTGALVGNKKNWSNVHTGDVWIAKYDGFDDWSVKMPNRVWNLRIETGTN